MFTRTSVHWAERIVATSSCSGDVEIQGTLGVGIVPGERLDDLGGLSFRLGGRFHRRPNLEAESVHSRQNADCPARGARGQVSDP